MYGYRASKVTNPIVVPDVVLRRTREIGNWDIAGVRQLNSTSDMNRYHIMRNRGYMARYFMAYGDFRPFLFAVGTLATAAKEVIRLVAVDREHLRTGLVQIAKGWWDSRKLLHDPTGSPCLRLPVNEQPSVAPRPGSGACADLEMQLGDAQIVERLTAFHIRVDHRRRGVIVGVV